MMYSTVLVSIGGQAGLLENQHCLLSSLMGGSSICHTQARDSPTLPDPLFPSVKCKAKPNSSSFVTCWARQVKRHLWKCHWLLYAKWTQGVTSHGCFSADSALRGLQMRILRAEERRGFLPTGKTVVSRFLERLVSKNKAFYFLKKIYFFGWVRSSLYHSRSFVAVHGFSSCGVRASVAVMAHGLSGCAA